jgi:hypothetical protein
MIQADKTLDGLVAERVISKKSVQDLLMEYMKKNPSYEGFVLFDLTW